jgi:hypothetical protein
MISAAKLPNIHLLDNTKPPIDSKLAAIKILKELMD